MDQMKTGKFIADMRKAQGLTQKELAEKLGLSDKTISKWECGNGTKQQLTKSYTALKLSMLTTYRIPFESQN